MKSYRIFLVICVLTSTCYESLSIKSEDSTNSTPLNRPSPESHSVHHYHSENMFELPTYVVYIIAFIILFMFLAIIGLAVALYFAINKNQIFGYNFKNVKTKEYVIQESTGIAKTYKTNDNDDKNNGSTLTINSGIIEVNRVSDPKTPTRLEDTKIIFTKRTLKPIVPLMHRGQMDALCKEVLRKVQKSDSASFRDLDELLKGKGDERDKIKSESLTESKKENEEETEIKTKLQIETKSHVETEIKKNDTPNENMNKIETDAQIEKETESKMKKQNKDMLSELKNELQCAMNNDVKIEVNHVQDNISAESSETETEYDTVPSPVRFRRSGENDQFELYNIPVYDCLPRRSFERPTKNVVQLDHDTQYLLPLTADQTESCYINCKKNRHSFNSS